jgi:hypothetical protein
MLGNAGCILTSHSKYCNALEAGDPSVSPRRSSDVAPDSSPAVHRAPDVVSAGDGGPLPLSV